MIFICFALVAGQLPPDVNESHYLTKAKHFWNPTWCPGDIFLGSSHAHWLFYFSHGLDNEIRIARNICLAGPRDYLDAVGRRMAKYLLAIDKVTVYPHTHCR